MAMLPTMFSTTLGGQTHRFPDLPTLLARASPARSGDALARVAARSAEERVAAQLALADVPLRRLLDDPVVPYETDEVTRLICDTHDAAAFAAVSHLTVGGLRDWLLSDAATPQALTALAPGLTPEMVAAVSKLCRLQDLMVAAARCTVTTRFRNTLGLPGHLSVRLQPNHPTDDPAGIAAAILRRSAARRRGRRDRHQPGDRQPGADACAALHAGRCANPAGHPDPELRARACHTTTLELIRRGSPVDLVFQSIGGTRGHQPVVRDRPCLAGGGAGGRRWALGRGTVGDNVMYFETGQGSALSAGAHHGVDQQTIEARAYAVARHFKPLLVNTVVGFIGPEYLADGQADHARRAGGPFLRQAAGSADGVRRLLHQPRGGRWRRHRCAVGAAGGRRG